MSHKYLAAILGAIFVALGGALVVFGALGSSNSSHSGASRAVTERPGARPCTITLTPSTGASAIAREIASAADGSTICLAGGSYPALTVTGAVHKRYVTVRSTPGATARVNGVEVANSSFLRFQNLLMTEGFNMRDTRTGASHDYQFIQNKFIEPLYGVVLYGNIHPIKRVLIEQNYMRGVHLEKPEVNGECSAGYAQGQDVTIDYAEGVTIVHNIFRQAAWHYLQGGAAGPEGVVVEHNLFEGRVMMACSHLNLWQIYGGGENDTFSNNIALGEAGQFASTDGVIFENGPGATECGTRMKNSTIENNLFVNAASAQPLEIFTTDGLTIRRNTSVRSGYGTAVLTERCGPGSGYTVTHNIDVESQQHPTGEPAVEGPGWVLGSFSGASLFDYNVSADGSASQRGSTNYVSDWLPSWKTTSWDRATEPSPPSGYYLPNGLPFTAGYEGGGGP